MFYVAVIFHPSFLEDHSQGQIFDFLRGIKKGNIESGSGKESMSTGWMKMKNVRYCKYVGKRKDRERKADAQRMRHTQRINWPTGETRTNQRDHGQ